MGDTNHDTRDHGIGQEVFSLHRGTAPLLVSLPHDGSVIPPGLAARMTPEARRAPDRRLQPIAVSSSARNTTCRRAARASSQAKLPSSM